MMLLWANSHRLLRCNGTSKKPPTTTQKTIADKIQKYITYFVFILETMNFKIYLQKRIVFAHLFLRIVKLQFSP